MRMDAALRCLSFTLLILALVGYCGLPSNPPADLFQSKWLQMASVDVHEPHRLVAPTQVKEHRAREGQLELERARSGKDKATAAIAPDDVSAPAASDTACSALPSCETATPTTARHPRAPPHGLSA